MDSRIVVLARDSAHTRALIGALAREFSIAAIVLEQGNRAQRRATLRFRLRRLGVRIVLGQLALVLLDRLWLRRVSRHRIDAILGQAQSFPADVPVTTVASVNDKECMDILESMRPDVCVVSGTAIIRGQVLKLAPVFLNIHCGITPAYRGVHGAFWAVCNRDFDNAGVTIHKIDPGVDTGEIVAQTTIALDPHSDTMRTLVSKQYAAGIPLMVKAVRDALGGNLKTFVRDDAESRQWYAPTLFEYRQFRKALASLRR